MGELGERLKTDGISVNLQLVYVVVWQKPTEKISSCWCLCSRWKQSLKTVVQSASWFLFSYRLLMLIITLKWIPCELIKMVYSSGWNNECPMDLFWPYEAIDTCRVLPLLPAIHLFSYFFHCIPRNSCRFQHYGVNGSHWKWFCWEMCMSQFFVDNSKSRCLGLA